VHPRRCRAIAIGDPGALAIERYGTSATIAALAVFAIVNVALMLALYGRTRAA